MNESFVTVSEIIASGNEMLGKQVCIYGKLIVPATSAYIIEAEDQPEDSAGKIVILDNEFLDKCMDRIPCRVGGPYYYYDFVEVEGTLIASNISGFSLGLSPLKTLTLFRNESQSVYEVNF